ncbi:hypothetical protein Tco_1011596 [Tanacetum coccineum]
MTTTKNLLNFAKDIKGVSPIEELSRIIELGDSLETGGAWISNVNPQFFIKDDIWCDDAFIIVKGHWRNTVGDCYMINIYGPQDSLAKAILWNRIGDFMHQHAVIKTELPKLEEHNFGRKQKAGYQPVRAAQPVLHFPRCGIDGIIDQAPFPGPFDFYLLLVNGSPNSKFSNQTWPHASSPLSPFLFILVMERLHNALSRGLLLSFGFKNNIQKSNVYGIEVLDVDISSMASNSGCASGSFLFIYLGLPIGSNMSLTSSWQVSLDRFQSKLSS